MTAPSYTDTATTGSRIDDGNVIEIVNAIFHRHNLISPLEQSLAASDEADDLVAALQVRARLDQSTAGQGMSLEDAMRAHGVDPADLQ